MHRFLRNVLSLVFVMASLTACNNDSQSESGVSATGANLCVGQAANTFHCIDNTKFQHCTGNNNFVVNSCPANFCASRTPRTGNPCIGRERAAQIDGVQPPNPGQAANAAPKPVANNGAVAKPAPAPAPAPAAPPAVTPGGRANAVGAAAARCVGGPQFDPAGVKNVGNGRGIQFVGGQCLRNADCATGCCALPCGICSGPGAQFQAGKQGCGFGN